MVSLIKVQPSTPLAEGLKVDFDPASRNVRVSFALASAGQATLRAYDLEGALVVTLLDARYEAGSHELSVFANSLGNAQGLILKLSAGGATRSHTWLSVR